MGEVYQAVISKTATLPARNSHKSLGLQFFAQGGCKGFYPCWFREVSSLESLQTLNHNIQPLEENLASALAGEAAQMAMSKNWLQDWQAALRVQGLLGGSHTIASVIQPTYEASVTGRDPPSLQPSLLPFIFQLILQYWGYYIPKHYRSRRGVECSAGMGWVEAPPN